jgi:enoyl-CoA hydratase
MSGTYRGLLVEREGPVGWLIFDRPEVGNAMDAAMLADLPRAWADLDDDPDVRVIVNTGNGSAFQTGLDVRQLARDWDALREQSRRTRDAELRISAWQNKVRTPVIAAVNGVCAGGGLHFVADADIVIAAERATFLDPHVSIGQVSAFEVIAQARRGAFEPVMRLALAGSRERLTAARAHQLGIVSEVVPDVRAAARRLAEKIASNPPEAVQFVKEQLWRALEMGLTGARSHAAAGIAGFPPPAALPSTQQELLGD